MKDKLLKSFNKLGKEGTTTIDIVVLLCSFVGGALGLDLGLEKLTSACGCLFLMESVWIVCNFISLVVTQIIINKKEKKSNIEKLIDEEIDKGENNK